MSLWLLRTFCFEFLLSIQFFPFSSPLILFSPLFWFTPGIDSRILEKIYPKIKLKDKFRNWHCLGGLHSTPEHRGTESGFLLMPPLVVILTHLQQLSFISRLVILPPSMALVSCSNSSRPTLAVSSLVCWSRDWALPTSCLLFQPAP